MVGRCYGRRGNEASGFVDGILIVTSNFSESTLVSDTGSTLTVRLFSIYLSWLALSLLVAFPWSCPCSLTNIQYALSVCG